MSAGWDDMVVVGRIARAHGLRGLVLVHVDTDFPDERFGAGKVVFAAPEGPQQPSRPLTVIEARPHLGRLLVAFEGVESIEEAEALGRGELRVPAGDLVPLPAGHFYLHELVGCEVSTRSGEPVGRVRQVQEAGGASLLVVVGSRGEVLVPLIADICVLVDVAARTIVLEPPEGLLDLNA